MHSNTASRKQKGNDSYGCKNLIWVCMLENAHLKKIHNLNYKICRKIPVNKIEKIREILSNY